MTEIQYLITERERLLLLQLKAKLEAEEARKK